MPSVIRGSVSTSVSMSSWFWWNIDARRGDVGDVGRQGAAVGVEELAALPGQLDERRQERGDAVALGRQHLRPPPEKLRTTAASCSSRVHRRRQLVQRLGGGHHVVVGAGEQVGQRRRLVDRRAEVGALAVEHLGAVVDELADGLGVEAAGQAVERLEPLVGLDRRVGALDGDDVAVAGPVLPSVGHRLVPRWEQHDVALADELERLDGGLDVIGQRHVVVDRHPDRARRCPRARRRRRCPTSMPITMTSPCG